MMKLPGVVNISAIASFCIDNV